MILLSLNKYQKSCVVYIWYYNLGIFNWEGRQSVDFADFWDFNYCIHWLENNIQKQVINLF